MSAICLTQPTTVPVRPAVFDGQPFGTPLNAATTDGPRVRTLRYVQHPSFRSHGPAARDWELDARRVPRHRPT